MGRHPLESFDLSDYFQWLAETSLQRLIVPAGPHWSNFPTNKPYVALQHDVDLNLNWAVGLAHAEEELGYQSTYAVMIGADTYDVTSAIGTNQLKTIRELGHNLALHFDWTLYMAMGLTVEEGISRDLKVLSALGFDAIGIVPHKPFRNGVPDLGFYQNMLIGNGWSDHEVYISDSGGGFRDSAIKKLFEMPDYLRLCTHPCWWQLASDKLSMSTRQQVVRDAVTVVEARLGAFLAGWDFESHPGAIEHDQRSTCNNVIGETPYEY